MTRTTIGLIAGALAIIQVGPYLRSVIRGATTPARASYVVWFVVNVCSTLRYVMFGARETAFVGVALCVTSLAVLICSFRWGESRGAWPDSTVLGVAFVLALTSVWINSIPVSLLLLNLSLIVGYAPTLAKAWDRPHTEHLGSWLLAFASSGVNLLAIPSPRIEIWLPPVLVATADLLVVTAILRPRWSKTYHAAREVA